MTRLLEPAEPRAAATSMPKSPSWSSSRTERKRCARAHCGALLWVGHTVPPGSRSTNRDVEHHLAERRDGDDRSNVVGGLQLEAGDRPWPGERTSIVRTIGVGGDMPIQDETRYYYFGNQWRFVRDSVFQCDSREPSAQRPPEHR